MAPFDFSGEFHHLKDDELFNHVSGVDIHVLIAVSMTLSTLAAGHYA